MKYVALVIHIITPEPGRLPEDLGGLAKYISGKSGGQGEVISALCEGLTERGVDVHLAVLNLKKRFQRESKLSAQQWREVRYKIDPEKIHLVSSGVFSDLLSAYGGNPLLNAAEFQREIVNNVIKAVSARHGGRLIVHTHDWMAGGIINAYLKARNVPVLHTVHNVFTGHVPLDMLFGVDLDDFSENLYYSEEYGRGCIDSQATAIKNATLINFVGEQFLKEVVYDYFMDRPLVPPGVRMEVKVKYFHGTAIAIINAPPAYMYPERCDFCVEKFGPDDDVLEAKRINRVEFQKRMGLTVYPDAILLFWPSRLDPTQKGVALLEHKGEMKMKKTFLLALVFILLAVLLSASCPIKFRRLQGLLRWEENDTICMIRDYVVNPRMDNVYLLGKGFPTQGVFRGYTIDAWGNYSTLGSCRVFVVHHFSVYPPCPSLTDPGPIK